MRFTIRDLLILLASVPPCLWAANRVAKPSMFHEWRQWTRQGPPGWKDDGGEVYYYPAGDSR